MTETPSTDPLFTFARGALDEARQQSDRLAELGAAQLADGARLLAALRAQWFAAVGDGLAAMESATREAMAAAPAWARPFGGARS